MYFWGQTPRTPIKSRVARGLTPKEFGIIVNFYPKFATIERYFYDTDNLEILTSDGIPFQSRQMCTGELARAPKKSCFK